MENKELFKSALNKMEEAMLLLGESHNLLAKTSLSPKEYRPVSGKFAKVKVDLFNVYHEIKDIAKQES